MSPQSANLRCLGLDDDDGFFSDDVASEARARNPATRQEESVGLESSVNVVGSDEVNVKPRLRLGLAPDLAEALTSDARGSDTPTVESKNDRRFVSHLWSVQLSEGLPWKPCAKFSFRHSSHINLLEAQVRKVLAKRVAAGCRYIVLQDSKVCLGAFNKGRSGSERLNRTLGIEAAYQLAKDVSFAGIHTPTWAIRADNPSRHLRVLASRIPLPRWFWLLQQGRVDRARALLDAISDTNRALARWALFGAVARSCATSAVPISSFRAKAEQGPQGSSGFGNRQSDSSHCSVPDVDVREIHRMGFGGVHAHSVVAPDCSV